MHELLQVNSVLDTHKKTLVTRILALLHELNEGAIVVLQVLLLLLQLLGNGLDSRGVSLELATGD